MTNELLTATQAAKILGITRQHMAELLRTEQVKGQKLGGTRWVTTRKAVGKYQRKKGK